MVLGSVYRKPLTRRSTKENHAYNLRDTSCYWFMIFSRRKEGLKLYAVAVSTIAGVDRFAKGKRMVNTAPPSGRFSHAIWPW